ncbi:MAG: hypothetical protein QXI27_00530 [Nitrososphaerota archaeon]
MRTLFFTILLISIIWVSFIAVLAVIGFIVLPIISGVYENLMASIMRVAASLLLFGLWLAWWAALAYYWFYRVLTRREK